MRNKALICLFVLNVLCGPLSARNDLDSLLNAASDTLITSADSITYVADTDPEEDGTNAYDPNNYYRADEYSPLPRKNVSLREIDRNKWKQAKKGLKYDEEKKEEDDDNNDRTNFRFDMPELSLFSGQFVKYFFIGIAIALLGLLLYFIVKSIIVNKNVKKDQVVVSVDDIEDIHAVEESELERLLREALERKAYNEAMRVYYTFALKALAGKGFIYWKKDKTNREYLREMTGNDHYALFNEITLVFEYVWYGERPIGEAEYNALVPKFKQLTENVKAENEK